MERKLEVYVVAGYKTGDDGATAEACTFGLYDKDIAEGIARRMTESGEYQVASARKVIRAEARWKT